MTRHRRRATRGPLIIHHLGFINPPLRPRHSHPRPFLLAEPLEPRLLLATTPLITEFMASNSLLADPDGDKSDWIEIHNPASTPLNLDGYYLSDDPAGTTRWRLPATVIPTGGYLLVWASAKNRAVPNQPLHTDFRLEASGGRLALLAPDGVTILHEYAPYPQQLPDISYGISVQSEQTPLIGPAGSLKYHVPTAPPPADWAAIAFDDSAWPAGAAGIGYDINPPPQPVPGFAVRMIDTTGGDIPNIGVATNLLGGNFAGFATAVATAAARTHLNFGDAGAFGSNLRLPNDPNGNFAGTNTAPEREQYAIRATADVVIPAGTYSVNVASDDGFRLRIPGVSFTGRVNENFSGAINPSPADTLVYGAPRGGTNTLATFTLGSPLSTTLTLDFYERGGGDMVELSVAQGAQTAFSTGAFSLLADGLHAWQVRSVPPVTQPDFNPLIATNVQAQMSNKASSIYVRMPFAFDEGDNGESVKLRVRYEDGFAAYLNGEFLASRNAPGSPQWDSSSLNQRADADGLVAEEIVVDVPAGLLVQGQNVLAIHGLNFGAGSSDFLLSPEFIGLGIPVSGDRYFTSATPGQANPASDLTSHVGDTTFSHDRGFYTSPFNLVIQTQTPGATIRYTTDGSPPTATSGAVYTGPIAISRTTVVRAAAFKPGALASNVDTQTYLFVNDVPNQTAQMTLNAGFPAAWGATSPDYGMDPDVVGPNDLFSGTYANSIRNDLKAIPTLSIVTSSDGLFGPSGIYTNSTASGPTWERPTSVELLYPDGREGFQIDAGLRTQGGAFRSHGLTKKHSLRLLFKNVYGAGKLNFPLFGVGGGAADSFDTITLRSEANDGWQWSSAGARPLYARDEFGRRTQLATGNAASHGGHVHLYINGIYWGLYNDVERPDAAFAATYFGGEKENWDAVNSGKAVDGNLTAWNTMMTIANDVATATTETGRLAGYMKIQGLNPDGTRNPAYPVYLDVDNLIDYMIVNLYMGNSDWPSHNWYAARDRGPESTGFKFFMWDAEWTLGLNSDVNANRVDVNIGPALAYSRLRASSEFRMRFADRLQMHFFEGGALYVDPVNPHWDPGHPERNVPAARMVEITDEIRQAIVAESARWGDQHRAALPYTRSDWEAELNRILTSYFPQRSGIVIGQFTTAGLFVDQGTVRAPVFSRNGGDVPAGFALTMSNPGPAGDIWYTLDGTDPRPVGGGLPRTGAMRYTGAITLNESAVVKARVLRLDGTWSPLNEKSFAVPLGTLKVSELMYNNPVPGGAAEGDLDYVELLNTGGTAINLRGLAFTSGITFTFPSNAAMLAPGARTVLVRNLAAFRSRYGDSVAVGGVFAGGLSDSGETLTLTGRAGETVFSFDYQDWYDITDGGGYSLVAIDPDAPETTLSTPGGWRPSDLAGGAPGVADPGINPGAVVINEVMAGSTSAVGDWVELYNTSSQPIDVSGWFVSDSGGDLRRYGIPGGTVIGAGGYALLHLPFDVSSVEADIFLANSDGAGNVAGYRDFADFGGSPADVSFGRFVTSTSDTDFTALTTPTPMAENAGAVIGPVVINEVMYNPAAGGHEFIELRNLTASAVSLAEWRFDGIDFTFGAVAPVPAFGYALLVPIDPAQFRSTYGIPAGVPVFGPYVGALDNAGEDVKLSRPGQAVGTVTPLVLVDKVKYDDTFPWPMAADGGGGSLTRLSVSAYGNDAASWTAGSTGGTPGVRNFPELAPVIDLGGDAVIPDGGTFQRGGVFHDPDSGESWSLTIDPGDGSGPRAVGFNGGMAFSFSHAYAQPGTYTVTASVSDGFFTGGDTVRVTVLPETLQGSGGTDHWAVRLDPGGTVLHVYQNVPAGGLPTFTLLRSAVNSLSIAGGGGDDTLSLEASLPGGVTFEGGAGENTVLIGGEGVRLTLDGDSSVLLDGSLDLHSLTLNGGSRAALPPRGSAGADAPHLRLRQLSVGSQAQLDLGDRGLILQAPGTQEAVATLRSIEGLIAGSRGTGWAGPGLTSSAALADPRGITGLAAVFNRDGSGNPLFATWHGHAVDPDSVLIGYAYDGDTDLSGIVDGDDLMRLDRGFLSRIDAGAGNDLVGYGHGDINLAGGINISDFFLMDRARATQGGPLGIGPSPLGAAADLFGPVIEGPGLDFGVAGGEL